MLTNEIKKIDEAVLSILGAMGVTPQLNDKGKLIYDNVASHIVESVLVSYSRVMRYKLLAQALTDSSDRLASLVSYLFGLLVSRGTSDFICDNRYRSVNRILGTPNNELHLKRQQDEAWANNLLLRKKFSIRRMNMITAQQYRALEGMEIELTGSHDKLSRTGDLGGGKAKASVLDKLSWIEGELVNSFYDSPSTEEDFELSAYFYKAGNESITKEEARAMYEASNAYEEIEVLSIYLLTAMGGQYALVDGHLYWPQLSDEVILSLLANMPQEQIRLIQEAIKRNELLETIYNNSLLSLLTSLSLTKKELVDFAHSTYSPSKNLSYEEYESQVWLRAELVKEQYQSFLES